ncbi:hypothetical protein GCM10029964_067900 [Kibdelosporangium lantanae]
MGWDMVMAMKSYARSLFFEPFGTTHMLPADPDAMPGHSVEPHWKSLMFLTSRPYHQLPLTMIGYLPWMNDRPMSSALVPAESLLM